MIREEMTRRIRERTKPWDMVIIGGGATGVGVAVDAASRGYDVALVEQNDFGKGTSSRSTKLVHGGVRYLEQGDVALVMEALEERGLMRQNAPHLVHDLAFVVPNYEWWEATFYGVGLKLYNLLAGKYGFGPSQVLNREETLDRLPALKTDGLRGGVVYYDGQFDDTRFLLHLAETGVEQGATLVNYVTATALNRGTDGFLDSVTAQDQETGETFRLNAKVVVNATGVFTDSIRRMAEPNAPAMVSPSQGVHIVIDQSFLRSNSAILVPHTSDGRVMFALPWHGHTLVGTTDTAIAEASLEPKPLEEEIDFLLETSARYLARTPKREDVLSTWAGIRPLVKATGAASTAALSRSHAIHIDNSGLLTITGGKWTTYRHMAEDCVNHAVTLAKLEDRPCVTKRLNLHGFHQHATKFGQLDFYGSDAPDVEAVCQESPEYSQLLHPALPYRAGQVAWAARFEMARSLEDVLSRRLRALTLNARAAVEMAPRAAAVLAKELNKPTAWEQEQVQMFVALAKSYVPA